MYLFNVITASQCTSQKFAYTVLKIKYVKFEDRLIFYLKKTRANVKVFLPEDY